MSGERIAMSAPDRIWTTSYRPSIRAGTWSPDPGEGTEYVRADLALPAASPAMAAVMEAAAKRARARLAFLVAQDAGQEADTFDRYAEATDDLIAAVDALADGDAMTPDDLIALGLAPPALPAPEPAQGYDTATEYEAARRALAEGGADGR